MPSRASQTKGSPVVLHKRPCIAADCHCTVAPDTSSTVTALQHRTQAALSLHCSTGHQQHCHCSAAPDTSSTVTVLLHRTPAALSLHCCTGHQQHCHCTAAPDTSSTVTALLHRTAASLSLHCCTGHQQHCHCTAAPDSSCTVTALLHRTPAALSLHRCTGQLYTKSHNSDTQLSTVYSSFESGHPVEYYQICIIQYAPSIHNIQQTRCNNYN